MPGKAGHVHESSAKTVFSLDLEMNRRHQVDGAHTGFRR